MCVVAFSCVGGTGSEISVSPAPGSYLPASEDKSSQVLLEDVQILQSTSERRYFSPWYPERIVYPGEPVVVVTGSVRNEYRESEEVVIYALGYDAKGRQVAWTLDSAYIYGQTALHLEYGEAGQFTLHLNVAENLACIRIFAGNYSAPPAVERI